MRIHANAKYAIIEQMVNREDNLLNVKWLCEAAGVSSSGYYHYLQIEEWQRLLKQMRWQTICLIESLSYMVQGPYC